MTMNYEWTEEPPAQPGWYWASDQGTVMLAEITDDEDHAYFVCEPMPSWDGKRGDGLLWWPHRIEQPKVQP